MEFPLFTEINVSPTLKEFILHLNNDPTINDLTKHNIRLAEEHSLPVMKQLKGLPSQQINNIFNEGWRSFFADIIQEQPMAGVYKGLNDWKQKKAFTEITSVDKTDITLGYHIRKQILVQQIEQFSNDPLKYINIVQELDQLISAIEKATLNHL